jgi:glycosyltransferase involved in cell wall biosynthesis
VNEPGPILQLLVSTRAGGGPQHVLTLALGLQRRGWRFVVAGPGDGPMVEQFRAAGVDVVPLPTDRLTPLTLLRLVRLIRARKVRLVHSHGKGAGLYGRLAARLAHVPAVHTFHGLHYERYPGPARALYLALERRLSTITRVVVNVSRAQEREGLSLELFRSGQSRVVLNGVDVARLAGSALERRDARAALGLDLAEAVVGCAARFDEVKRLDVLVQAAALSPGFALVLIGDGPEGARLRRLAAELGVARRLRVAGEVPEAARLFPAFDVFASAARKEGLPLAVVEAMALGLAVVASDIPAHREVLGAPCEGLVDGTAGAFAVRLSSVLADAGLRARLGAQNRTRARSEFDVRDMLAALEAVYEEVLAL